ncbi:reverse transcriptase domain-containing protein [Trichonephila clavipes]|nr:reverse transcriptase domain-containing protein [Trichonephila clavipes]
MPAMVGYLNHWATAAPPFFSSSYTPVTGVPQGSILNTLIFFIYVNDIHPNINDDTVACYADDIAIWYSGREIDISEKKLQLSLNEILKWAQSLILKINVEKTTVCVFTADRKHRSQMDPQSYIEGKLKERTTYQKYLFIILDAEVRFAEHIKTCASRALKKLKIIKSHCSTDWGASPKTLKTTYT